MPKNKLGRWVARIAVTLGLGVAVAGGAAVLSTGSALAAPSPTTVHQAPDASISYTGSTDATQTTPTYQLEDDAVWW